MNILYYSPFNQRSRDTESLMIAKKNRGHRVISLSQAEGKLIHDHLKNFGIETYSYKVSRTFSILFYLKHLIYLIRFCNKNKIDVIFSHLETSNFVAVLAQYFIRAKVYINRHHINEAALRGFDKSFAYRLTYKAARNVIVVSNKALHYSGEVEKIDPSKLRKINLAYDFSLYAQPNPEVVKEIRNSISSGLVLISACRLTKFKRADLSIKVVKKLNDNGIDTTLILLGQGEEEHQLRQLTEDLGIELKVFMPGHVSNIIDYLAASDMLVHPSVLESSCVIVKEAAITRVPVVVCKGIGDFDEYIVHEENGFIVSVEDEKFVNEAFNAIEEFHLNKRKLEEISSNLKSRVLSLFNIEHIIDQYDEMLRNK